MEELYVLSFLGLKVGYSFLLSNLFPFRFVCLFIILLLVGL